ncbi:MAG: hypothetical protein LBM74_03565 [Oscillospiraceae bacterium]|jgi:acetyltransferase-like isoleucine patch superfamily enzyme|nr:hypothetical protein [Oscillospiraceae bacterium]
MNSTPIVAALRAFLVSSPFVHRFTNTPLLGNRTAIHGRGNRVEQPYAPVMRRFSLSVRGDRNHIAYQTGGYFQDSAIYIIGSGNRIIMGAGVHLRNCLLWISADNATIELGDGCVITKCEMGAEGEGSRISVGRSTLVGGFMWLHDRINRTLLSRLYAVSAPLIIGADGMISDGVTIRTGDSHTIINPDDTIANAPAPVRLGAHCWVCSGATILKGGAMGEGCVLGANSLLTRDYHEQTATLLVGMPASIRREGIRWQK